jgi:hypothetical protein
MAGLVVAVIACIPYLRDWGMFLGPVGTLKSKLRSLANAEVWDPVPQLLYCTVISIEEYHKGALNHFYHF